MLRRVGFRWLLPLANLLLYVALILRVGAAQPSAKFVPVDSTVSPSKTMVPARTKFVVALNVPAVLAGFGLNAIALHRPPNCLFLLAIPFIPLLWFLVGRWIDRRLGWLPLNSSRRSVFRDAMLWVLAIVGILSVVVYVQVYLLMKPHTRADPFWMGFGLTAWFGFLLLVLAGRVYARLSQKRA